MESVFIVKMIDNIVIRNFFKIRKWEFKRVKLIIFIIERIVNYEIEIDIE